MSQARLGVVFTAWFGFDPATGEMIGGLGSSHWNDGPDTAGIVHTPYQVPGAIGKDLPAWAGPSFYCSADPVIVSYQIEKMSQAGQEDQETADRHCYPKPQGWHGGG